MARPITYDPEKMLLSIMHLFWEKGYETTSIQDIVAVSGLKPGSLYNLYGNKEGIFEAVMSLYAELLLQQVRTLLEKEGDALDNISLFLKDIVVATIANTQTNGCLLVKTLLVIPPKDTKIQEQIAEVFSTVETLLTQVLEKAKQQYHLRVNPTNFATFMMTTIYGAHVYYKTHKDEQSLHNDVDMLLTLLKAGKR